MQKLKELLPYGGALIIFLGILKLSSYYSAFNIKINNYLDLSEYLTAFLDDTLFYIIWICLIAFLDFDNDKEVELREMRNNELIGETKLSKRLSLFSKPLLPFVILVDSGFSVFWLILYFRHTRIPWISFSICVLFNMLFFVYFLLLEHRRKYFILHKTRMDPTISNLLLFLPTILFFVYLSSIANVYDVKERKIYAKTIITLDSTVLNSDSTHYYIGNTHGYLFYFLQDSGRTIVIPMNRVKQISFNAK